MGFEKNTAKNDSASPFISPSQHLNNETPRASKFYDEDFSTETLMDVELSTIDLQMKNGPSTHSTPDEDLEKTRHFDLLPESNTVSVTDKTELDVVITLDTAPIDIADDSKQTKNMVSADKVDNREYSIPDETTDTRSDDIGKKTPIASSAILDNVVDDFEVNIPEKKESNETQPVTTEQTEEVTVKVSETQPSPTQAAADEDIIIEMSEWS